jgi:tRNA-splicing ligase RtcB (3'-phosphate/5'-hydroxy nucleic acid ligase)
MISVNEKIKVWSDDIEAEAMKQIENVSKMPFVENHVAVMPDAHAGRGSTIGTVIATQGAIIPSCVGVDIGCGMKAVRLPFKVDMFGDTISVLRSSIERSIPVGFNQHNNRQIIFCNGTPIIMKNSDKLHSKASKQIGTLGGGNHFIEICKDQNNDAWVMLHSGSRNIGKVLAEHHINKAKNLMKEYFISLPDHDLAYLVQSSPEFHDYINDLNWAQSYAKMNREKMMTDILKDISFFVYDCYKPPEHGNEIFYSQG